MITEEQLDKLSLKQLTTARDRFAEHFISNLKLIIPGADIIKVYVDYFANLPPLKFREHMRMKIKGNFNYPIVIPNFSEQEVDIDKLIKVGDKLGIKFQQHITLTDQKDTSVTITPPKRAYVIKDYVRRQLQTFENKVSIPTHADVIDDSTGQVTGDSKGSALSSPEARFMLNKGLDVCVYEFFSPLGGNNASYDLLEDTLIERGTVSINDIQTEDRAGAIDFISTMFTSAGIKNNF